MSEDWEGSITPLEPVVSHSMSEDVYSRLRQAIVDGDLAPGHRLTEQALAQALQVSRTPVREALKQLKSEGLVNADGHRGLIVSRMSVESIAQAYQVREVLEGLAAKLASERPCAPEMLDRLKASLRAMGPGSVSPAEYDRAHGDFHDTVTEMAQNSFLSKALQELAAYRTRMVSLDWIPKTRVERSYAEHQAIFEAVIGGRADEAESLAKGHVRKTRDALIGRLNGQITNQGTID